VRDPAEDHASHIDAAIAALSPQQRVALVLHYFDDLAVADVAHAMAISEGAVKYHLHEARARLRTALEDADG
jgi:RNA polymerase sigma factor (sigma-70 family)